MELSKETNHHSEMGAMVLTDGASFWFSNERKVVTVNKKPQKVPKRKQAVAKSPPGYWKKNSPKIQMQQEWLNMDTEPKLQVDPVSSCRQSEARSILGRWALVIASL